MAQALQLTYGRVKYPANEPRQTTHGLRINSVISLPSGEEIKLWGDPGDPLLTALKKGQQVALAQNAKGNWQLVNQQEQSPQPSQNNAVQNQSEQWSDWTADEKRHLAAKVQAHAKLFRYCLEQAKEHCGDLVESEESIRAIATTLFEEALKPN